MDNEQKTIVITKSDLEAHLYKFAPDVRYKHMEGVSPHGHKRGATPDAKIDVTFDFGGVSVQSLIDPAVEKYGVNFRAVCRETSFYPEDGFKMTVKASEAGRFEFRTLPPAVQAKALLMSVPVEQRAEVREAMLKLGNPVAK